MIPAITLFISAVLYRLLAGYVGAEHPWMLNFSPITAIALCGPLIFPRRIALLLPVGVLLASDLVLNAHFGAALLTWEMAVRCFCLALVALLGLQLRLCRNS